MINISTERKPSICHSCSFAKSYIFLICLFIIPIVATIIYIGFRGDLDKCYIGYKRWMLSIIIMGFILIVGTIVEKYHNSNNNKHTYIILCCSITSAVILCIVAFVLIAGADNENTCRKASPPFSHIPF